MFDSGHPPNPYKHAQLLCVRTEFEICLLCIQMLSLLDQGSNIPGSDHLAFPFEMT